MTYRLSSLSPLIFKSSTATLFWDSRKMAGGRSLRGCKDCHVVTVKPISVNQSPLLLLYAFCRGFHNSTYLHFFVTINCFRWLTGVSEV